eukprot:CAMPEP_0202890190 /NCGR_PEP_ID=MMETSP1392-20130828/697_1 /ASSEMBLY_ACC=CAM_ASM_000868 /TAXON_ID=225041 /ORGANISM="Chlamydomonas chlamydogama, Strain SAG 11-48b" /LENGTH=358 /DNA_ID=CAMNT_0049573723 /DNA_START=190 /DNA_END=1263 /DNA_ORIENTATION=+
MGNSLMFKLVMDVTYTCELVSLVLSKDHDEGVRPCSHSEAVEMSAKVRSCSFSSQLGDNSASQHQTVVNALLSLSRKLLRQSTVTHLQPCDSHPLGKCLVSMINAVHMRAKSFPFDFDASLGAAAAGSSASKVGSNIETTTPPARWITELLDSEYVSEACLSPLNYFGDQARSKAPLLVTQQQPPLTASNARLLTWVLLRGIIEQQLQRPTAADRLGSSSLPDVNIGMSMQGLVYPDNPPMTGQAQVQGQGQARSGARRMAQDEEEPPTAPPCTDLVPEYCSGDQLSVGCKVDAFTQFACARSCKLCSPGSAAPPVPPENDHGAASPPPSPASRPQPVRRPNPSSRRPPPPRELFLDD